MILPTCFSKLFYCTNDPRATTVGFFIPSFVSFSSAGGAASTFSTLATWLIGTLCSNTVSRLCLAVAVTIVFLPSLESLLPLSSASLIFPLNLAFADTTTACFVDSSSTSTLPPLTFFF